MELLRDEVKIVTESTAGFSGSKQHQAGNENRRTGNMKQKYENKTIDLNKNVRSNTKGCGVSFCYPIYLFILFIKVYAFDFYTSSKRGI